MWKKLPCYSRDASASCSKSVQLTDCCSKELPCKLQFVSIAGTTRPPRVARGDRTHLRPRILWPTQTVDRTGELHRYGLRWTVTSWAFTEKVNAIGWRQSQLGHPRRAVGLLVGLHRITAARLSSSATVTSTVLHWVPCGLSRYTATADGLYSATADSPATAPGPLCRQDAIAVRGSADQVQPGEPRTEPATDYRQNRCSRAGFADLSGLEHEHPVGVGEHRRSWVINTAERPTRTSTSTLGTPSGRHSAVLAPAVLRLSVSAVVDDLLVINARSATTAPC